MNQSTKVSGLFFNPKRIKRNVSNNLDDDWVKEVHSVFDFSDQEIACDILIVGSGPGGSVSAAVLAQKGFDVLVVEEGKAFSTADLNGSVSEMTQSLYRNGGAVPIIGRPMIPFGEAKCFGGGSVINGGVIWRAPSRVIQSWQSSGDLDSLSADRWTQLYELVEHNLNVQVLTPPANSNLPSVLLTEGAKKLNWKTGVVPRALKACQNNNICAAGCPSGAKQSVLFNYLAQAKKAGARFLTEGKVTQIYHDGSRAYAARVCGKRSNISVDLRIKFKKLFIAAGATQSPILLRRNRMSHHAGTSLRFHLNMKVTARFDHSVNPQNSTIYTVQVQEFEHERMLFMPTNFHPSYLAMGLQYQKPHVFQQCMSNLDHFAIYVAVIQPGGKAKLLQVLDFSLFAWKFAQGDRELIQGALVKLCELLFASGAQELFLPIKGARPVRSLDEVKDIVSDVNLRDLDVLSVHGMSGCRIGQSPEDSSVNQNGKLWGFENVFVSDSSVLPTSTGESPQATIMALAHHIAENCN